MRIFAQQNSAIARRSDTAASGLPSSAQAFATGVRPSAEGRPDDGIEPAWHRPRPELIRQCQALLAKVWLTYPQTKTKVTLFVGPTAGCGVSTVAAGFVGALATDPAARILFIDFDLPKLPASLDMPGGADLLRLLEHASTSARPSASARNVHALSTANFGRIPPSLFQSEAFSEFLAVARERFDHVVIDGLPLQDHAESLVLSRKADGVVLVVQAGRTRKRTALWARQQIEAAGGSLLGVVLNRRKYYLPRWLYERL